jgi:hypothetical protein
VNIWIENMFLCTWSTPWLESFRYCVSTPSSCRKWYQDTLHYLQRSLVRLVVARRQGLYVFWRNRLPEISVHWSLFSRAHTKNSMQWVRVAVCREHEVRVSLSRKHRYHPQTEQDEFQMRRGHHLYIDCIILVKDGNLRNLFRYFSLRRKFALYQDFRFSISEKRRS